MGSLNELKTTGATWDQKTSTWKLPATLMNLRWVTELLMEVTVSDSVTVEDYDQCPSVCDDPRLLDFQRPAVDRLVCAPHGQLLCATPGLGKTAMSIVAADIKVPDDQVVVVAPASLLRTWEREIAKWAKDPTVAFVRGDPDWDEVKASRWLVTSWDVLARHQEWFVAQWPLWILDESVLAKSRHSQRSMAVSGGRKRARQKADGTVSASKHWENLRRYVGQVWLLSGSPTTRYADDLWKQLAIIYPRAFKSYWRFAERYCHVEETTWARVVTGTRRDHDVVKDNADLVYVISQEDVLDLPEYLFEAVDVDLTPRQQRAYDSMERDFIAQLDSGELLVSEAVVSQLIHMQQIASYWEGHSAKHDAIVELFGSGAYETPALVWTHWSEGARALAERLGSLAKTVHVHGEMSGRAKDEAIEAYKRGDADFLVLSLGVGKFGHTLTNTKTVVYVDKTWNADDYHQSLRRVRRIGLSHSPVVVSVRAPKTVDRLVEANLEGKIEGIARVTNADLRELVLGLGRGL
jgi:SNF2 family DNA or RNA helicase